MGHYKDCIMVLFTAIKYDKVSFSWSTDFTAGLLEEWVADIYEWKSQCFGLRFTPVT